VKQTIQNGVVGNRSSLDIREQDPGTAPEESQAFPESVEYKSSKVIIYRSVHRNNFRYEVRHHDSGGNVQRATFDNCSKAKKHANALVHQMANGGLDMLVLRGPQRRAYERAVQMLEPHGLELDVFISDSLKAVKLLKGVGDLCGAADFFAKHRPKAQPTISVESAVAEFIESRKIEEVGPLYLRDLRLRLGRFANHFGCPLSLVSRHGIDKYLDSLPVGKRTRYNHRGTVGTLLNCRSMAVRMPMMAITTSSSIKVNAARPRYRLEPREDFHGWTDPQCPFICDGLLELV